jgi:hypothetical protein
VIWHLILRPIYMLAWGNHAAARWEAKAVTLRDPWSDPDHWRACEARLDARTKR